MSNQPLHEAASERILLADGAMGTELHKAGLAPGTCGEIWNLDFPERVRAIQAAYAAAGADCIITNTFGGCSRVLGRHGHQGRVAEINRAAAEIARQALGDRGWVLGDVGPFGDFLQPFGQVTEDELYQILAEQIGGLLAGGADAILLETQSAIEEAAIGVRAARDLGAKSVIASFTFQKAGEDYRTMMGASPADIVERLAPVKVDIFGVNCGTGLQMEDYAKIVSDLASLSGKPVMAQPNAGQPEMVDGKLVYRETPEKMAERIELLTQAGARIVGGCCGTTPEHIRLFRREIDRLMRAAS